MSSIEATELPTAEPQGGDFGQKLRLRRVVRGMSIQQVADKSGISVGQISQIERGISSPSMRSLQKICMALDMPMGWLFESVAASPPDGDVIVRKDERRRIVIEASGIAKGLMTPDACPRIQMINISILPGGGWEGPFFTFERKIDARCGTVVSGKLRLCLDGAEYILGPGDSFATGPRKTLGFWCEGNEECELIWVATPAIY